MAVRYCRSTDGSNADNGTTWALAKATLAGLDAIDTAGDTLWLSQVHSESTAATVTIACAGTLAAPTKILCGNDGAEPPTALAAGALLVSTGTSDYILNGSLYGYGFTIKAATGSTGGNVRLGETANNRQVYESCEFWVVVNIATSGIILGNATFADIKWINCNVKFANAGQAVRPCAGNVTFHWNGGAMVSGSTTPTKLVKLNTSDASRSRVLLENLDLSAFGAAMCITEAASSVTTFIIRNSKLPGSWSGTLITGGAFTVPGGRVSMYNCDSGSTNYKLWIETYEGSIRDETVIVRTGGANDGVTSLSWKMVANGSALFPLLPLISDEFVIWNDNVGVSRTITVEYMHDTNVAGGQGAGTGSAFQNNEVWLEVQYSSSPTAPQSSIATSAPTVIASASDNSAGVGTGNWTTTGLTTPKSGKVSVTFTPQQRGFLLCRVFVGKASKTIYIDPYPTVS